MIGFVLGAVVLLIAGYVIAKHHWRARELGASLAADSVTPAVPWHPHFYAKHDG